MLMMKDEMMTKGQRPNDGDDSDWTEAMITYVNVYRRQRILSNLCLSLGLSFM